jgi:hypothetical protein
MSPLVLVLIILLVVSLGWGSWGYPRVAPSAPWVGGWSPFGLVLIVLLVLYLTGGIRLR